MQRSEKLVPRKQNAVWTHYLICTFNLKLCATGFDRE